MKILYYNCFAGISGDMNLAALIDLGVPANYLISEINKLNLGGYKIQAQSAIKNGISGTKVKVHLEVQENHKHRNLADIRNIIDASLLNTEIKNNALKTFEIIARAEAKIHAKTIDEIHFHEVGAIDSIIDIVGAAICIDYLKPDAIVASTVELGGGFVTCAHGTFPVPAPATTEILTNIPVRVGTVQSETTTPTGAAILKNYVNEFSEIQKFTPVKTAYGIGHRDMDIPNVLRVMLAETNVTGNYDQENAILVECNIDDMNPEYYDYVIEKLFAAGAQDVFMIPIIMKKSRPAIQLKALCHEQNKTVIEHIILSETTTLGTRSYAVDKTMLERNIIHIETKFGPIQVKEALLEGKSIKYKAEYTDCVRAAKEYNVNLRSIYTAVDDAMKKYNN